MPYVKKRSFKRRRRVRKRLPMKRRMSIRKPLRQTSYCCKRKLIQHNDQVADETSQVRGLIFYTLNTMGTDILEFSEHWSKYRIRKVVTTFECAFNEALTPTFASPTPSTNQDGQYPKIAVVADINADVTPTAIPGDPNNPDTTLYAVLAAKNGCRTMIVRPGAKMRVTWKPRVATKVIGQYPNGTAVDQTSVAPTQWYDSDFCPNVMFGYLKWAMQPFNNNLEGNNQPTVTVTSYVYLEFKGTASKFST